MLEGAVMSQVTTRVRGSILLNSIVVFKDVAIELTEITDPVSGFKSWIGDFTLRNYPPLDDLQELYRLELNDGRAGDVLFINIDTISSDLYFVAFRIQQNLA